MVETGFVRQGDKCRLFRFAFDGLTLEPGAAAHFSAANCMRMHFPRTRTMQNQKIIQDSESDRTWLVRRRVKKTLQPNLQHRPGT